MASRLRSSLRGFAAAVVELSHGSESPPVLRAPCVRSSSPPHWLPTPTRPNLQAAPTAAHMEVPPVGLIDRQHARSHRYMVRCVCWYPVDTGLFVTGGADSAVKLWDTNT